MIPDKLPISFMVDIATTLGYRNRNGDALRATSVVIAARRAPARIGAVKDGGKYTGLWYICDYDKFFSWLDSMSSNKAVAGRYRDTSEDDMICEAWRIEASDERQLHERSE